MSMIKQHLARFCMDCQPVLLKSGGYGHAWNCPRELKDEKLRHEYEHEMPEAMCEGINNEQGE